MKQLKPFKFETFAAMKAAHKELKYSPQMTEEQVLRVVNNMYLARFEYTFREFLPCDLVYLTVLGFAESPCRFHCSLQHPNDVTYANYIIGNNPKAK